MLYHFSENPKIQCFSPRTSDIYPHLPPVVWAIDGAHAPLYYFPRECPRVTFWKRPDSTKADIERFLSGSTARMVIAVEGAWLDQIHRTNLYVYAFKPDTFHCFDAGAGYYVSEETVLPESVHPVGDLIKRLLAANVELRITPTLFPLHDAVVNSSLQFSMIRMRNASPLICD